METGLEKGSKYEEEMRSQIQYKKRNKLDLMSLRQGSKKFENERK